MRAVRQFLWARRVPLIAVALAALHSLLFWSLGPRVPLGLFIAAVMVSAWQGGLRPAVFATALSTLALAVISFYQAPGPEEDLVLRLGLFVLVGLIAGYLGQQCRQAIRAVDHVHDILGGGGIALISADAEGRVTSLNPLARTLTGLGEADAQGRPLGDVFRAVDGSSRQPLTLPASGAVLELPEGALLLGPHGGETAVAGTVGPARDGDDRPAGVIVVFREAGGRTQAWQELRQRADRFRALAGYAPSGLMVLDAEGRCVFCNPAAQSACGCSADECLGEGWSRHVQPQDRDRLISDWLKAVVGKAVFAGEFRVQAGQGATRWLRLRSAPMLADGGEVLGHVAALEEVTEHRQAAEALADARRESEEQLQEWAAAEKQAAEALRAARAEADRTLCEEAVRRQQAEQALAQARQEAHEHEATGRRTEEEMRRLREEMQRRDAEGGTGAEEVRATREALGAAWGAEVEAVVAMHLDARAHLAEELTGHREALRATRDAHDRLQSALVEKDGTAEALRQELGRFQEEAGATRQAHDRLQALLAERGGNEESLRQELERLAEDASAVRRSHDRLEALLAQKDANEAALRQEVTRLEEEAAAARQAHDGARAALTEKGGAEESLRQQLERLKEDTAALLAEKAAAEAALRQESERLRGEEAARRQTEEAHERLRSALGEKERGEESLRQELARLQGDLRERQRAEDELRREKDFLDGVLDGSPTGIFAHDRDGRCRVWNAALERLLGRPKADALGRTAFELFPPSQPGPQQAAEGAPPSENGAGRADLATTHVIGRSELLESAHAPIRDQAGEVIGGMALVRVLPPPAVAGENGAGRHTNGAVGGAAAVTRIGGIDWLAFN